MKIYEVIEKVKDYHNGVDAFTGKQIDDQKTRDKILYGDANQDCKGIVTTCFASVDVIKKAHELGANLIIAHEAMFYNHGDHTDILMDNKVFLEKKKLLDETGIVVWRNHDYVHSGIPMKDGSYSDGIFYGIMKVLGWEDYLIEDKKTPLLYKVKKQSVQTLANEIIDKFNLNGIRVVGDPNTMVENVLFPFHIMGQQDNEIMHKVDQENIDVLITMECTDYTVNEYIRDSAMLKMPKTILAVGHFNVEEPGMQYMVTYVKDLVDVDVHYVQSGDTSKFIVKNHLD